MEEKTLQFETGIVRYHLGKDLYVSFNPTDTAFVERLYTTFEELDKKQDAYKAELAQTDDLRKAFAAARQLDAEMRGTLDAVLGAPVCDTLFGDMSIYALADGMPVWANILLAIIDEMDTTVTQQTQLTAERIRKYSAKYRVK